MKQSVGLFIVAVVLAGCQNSPPANNPFLRTTVPPPGTGQAVVAPAGDPYYPPAVQTPGTAAPVAPVVVTPAPPPTVGPPPTTPPAKFTPPPGTVDYLYHQSSINRTKVVDPRAPGYRPGSTVLVRRSRPAGSREAAEPETLAAAEPQTLAAAATAGALPIDSSLDVAAADGDDVAAAQHVPDEAHSVVRSVVKASFRDGPDDPTSVDSSGSQSRWTAATERIPSSPTGKDETQLQSGGESSIRILTPERTSSNTAEVAEAAPPDESSVLKPTKFAVSDQGSSNPLSSARAASTLSGAIARAAARPVSASGYGYGTNYDWLSGRLEYSQAAKQWKLRYIPIDGSTDRFGGSVVLRDSPLLAERKPGEFVSIQGTIVKPPSGGAGFSPLYDLRQVDPLTP